MEEEFTTEDNLEELAEAVEDFWATLNDDGSLDEDTKARITVVMEPAEEAIAAARKLIGDLPESD
jgi:hypothetical protein